MTSSDWVIIAAVAVLFLLSILLAAAETALTRVSLPKAQALAETKGRSGRTLLRLVEHQEWLNPLLLIVLASQSIQSLLLGSLAEGGVGLIVIGLLNITVFFVFAEVAPKTWAILHTERAALLSARPVAALAAFPPLRWISRGLIGLTNVILPGKGLKEGPFLSEEELLAVADLAVEGEVIEAEERQLIESLLEFGDTIVREVMVPRPDMVTVNADFRVADVVEVAILNGFSRLPVTGSSIDDVVGVAYLKDLVRAERDGHADEPVCELARSTRFVPETKRVADLLREMRQEKVHLAVVVDEHGGTAGLITLEDLLEELVGEITDEYDVEAPEVAWGPDGAAVVPGSTPVDEVNERLYLELPEDEEYDSVGGFVLHELGRVPAAGESVEADGARLVVDKMQGNRIERVRIERRVVE
jgi:CBS domain containing-hemolysin-like protein